MLLPPRSSDQTAWRGLAGNAAEAIKTQYKYMRETAADDEDVIINVILSNGQEITLKEFGYLDPYMIFIRGYDHQNNKVIVMVSFASAQIVIKTIKRLSSQKKSDIGFLNQINGLPVISEKE